MYANIYLRSTIFLRDNGLSFIVSLIAIKTPETNIINIPIIDKKFKNSPNIMIPQKIEKTNAEYSKGATRPAKLNL